MKERFGVRMARTVGVGVASLLLVAGGAFAANNIASTVRGGDQSPAAVNSILGNQAEPTETAEPTESAEPTEASGTTEAAATAEPTETPEASEAAETPEPSDDPGPESGSKASDDGTQGPGASGPHDGQGGGDGAPDSPGDPSGHG
jgi:hypothetical protein